MAAKIDSSLRAELRREAKANPDTPLKFIITLRSMEDCDTISKRDFHIDLHLDAVLAVSGTATPRTALALARLPQVRRIEIDGDTFALS